jgi:MoaA/NifB/PqqE/SkfB family radical SAM enzyme
MIGQINIETTSYCNAECIICPHKTMKRKPGMMEEALWRKILTDCDNQALNIHYHLNGEPLMNPVLPRIIEYGRQFNPNSKHVFYTNGALLGKRAQEFFNNPKSLPDEIMISFDGGTKEIYELHRKGLVFEDTISSIVQFIKARKECGSRKPTIHPLMVVTKENAHTIEQFKALFTSIGIPKTDLVLSGPMNWAGAVNVQVSDKIKWNMPCPYLFNNHLFILHTGEAVMCCMDYEGTEIMGDCKTESVHDICYKGRYQEMRGMYINKQWAALSLCKNCSFGRLRG